MLENLLRRVKKRWRSLARKSQAWAGLGSIGQSGALYGELASFGLCWATSNKSPDSQGWAPDSLVCQTGNDSLAMSARPRTRNSNQGIHDRWTMPVRCTPDSSVYLQIDEVLELPNEAPTALRSLRAIKGTPRRHGVVVVPSITREHQHSDSSHPRGSVIIERYERLFQVVLVTYSSRARLFGFLACVVVLCFCVCVLLPSLLWFWLWSSYVRRERPQLVEILHKRVEI
jgi:hypothetical protein